MASDIQPATQPGAPARVTIARADVGLSHAWRLFRHFFVRELRNRFLGSFSGGLWALIQPLVQLAIYSFVFVYIFKARVPGADAPGYVPFLLVALWPWTAFSESISRATTAIVDNAGLIGKVAMPRSVPVLAVVASSFALHTFGFVAIVLVMPLFGDPAHLAWLPLVLLVQSMLMLLAAGFALALSAMQVFVRDLVQVVTQVLMLAMFAAPIFYARAAMPEWARGWIDLHPFTWYARAMRDMLLHGHAPALVPSLVALLVALVLLGVGSWLFHRLDPHFEDFL
ncbi:MAG TPA: ABC transporter permease [Rhodanobacteraceae bacterium]|nr:ABC transporter permease [Rhodanobacteraceae bacterium]